VKFFSHRRLIKEFSTKNWKIRKLYNFLCKLRTTGSIEPTVMTGFKMCCLYVVLVLPGSVETQGKMVNFVNSFVEYSFMFPLAQKV